MQQFLVLLVGNVAITGGPFLLTLPVFIGLGLWERFGPVWGPRPALVSQLRAFTFQLVGLVMGNAVIVLLKPFVPQVNALAPWIALPLALLVSDFIQYWQHRVEHWWIFWRVHSVHHSGRDLACTSNISNFLHQPLMVVTYGLPMSLICPDPMAVTWVTLYVYSWSAMIHSPAKIDLGPLRRIFPDARHHRIHHSMEERHFDKNFGALLTVWDWMFGTVYWPAADEWPATGVHEYGEIETVWGLIARPFLPNRPPQPQPLPQEA